MRDPVRISRKPLPTPTLFGFSKSAVLNLAGGFFLGVSFMGVGVAGMAIVGMVEFRFPQVQQIAADLPSVTPSVPIENEMENVLMEPVTIIIPATETPVPIETATSTPDFAATATSACGDFLEQFPGTPCPE